MKTADYNCKICERALTVPAAPDHEGGDQEEFEAMFDGLFSAIVCNPCGDWRAGTRNQIKAIEALAFKIERGGSDSMARKEDLISSCKVFLEIQFQYFGRCPLVLDDLTSKILEYSRRTKWTLLKSIHEVATQSKKPQARQLISAARVTD